MPLKRQKTKSLSDLLKRARDEAPARPRKISAADQPPLVYSTISLTPATKAVLEQLLVQASGRVGRKVSASAVVRALLRYTEQRGLATQVLSLIETEIDTGEVVWGKVRKSA
jgi:hypothetical protein